MKSHCCSETLAGNFSTTSARNFMISKLKPTFLQSAAFRSLQQNTTVQTWPKTGCRRGRTCGPFTAPTKVSFAANWQRIPMFYSTNSSGDSSTIALSNLTHLTTQRHFFSVTQCKNVGVLPNVIRCPPRHLNESGAGKSLPSPLVSPFL